MTAGGSDIRHEAGEESEPEPEARRRLALDIVRIYGDWSLFEPVEDAILAAGTAVSARLGARGTVAVALSSDDHVRDLNRAYRGHDKPTNVLSFPASVAARAASELGDIVLAAQTMAREAAEQAKPPRQHLQHLVVHGLLHLLGYDHETDAEALRMEELETAILADIGIADPYTDDEETASTLR
jgi:probable rRNA maturation factor